MSSLAAKVFTNRINQPQTSTISAILPLKLGVVLVSSLFVGHFTGAAADALRGRRRTSIPARKGALAGDPGPGSLPVRFAFPSVGQWGWGRAGQHRAHPNSAAMLVLGSILDCHDLDDPSLCR